MVDRIAIQMEQGQSNIEDGRGALSIAIRNSAKARKRKWQGACCLATVGTVLVLIIVLVSFIS